MRHAVAVLAFFAVCCAPASAAVVSTSGGTITIAAGAAETNTVTVTPPVVGIAYTITDTGGTVPTTSGMGCNVTPPDTVTCFNNGLNAVNATLGDLADSLDTTAMGAGIATTAAGGDGNDTITTGAGADTIEPGSGTDTANGGGGLDTVSYVNSTTRVVVNLNSDSVTEPDAGNTNDSIPDIENVTGSDINNTDHITGDGGPNRIRGGAGSDSIFGQGGDDTLESGGDGGLMWGGDGNDSFFTGPGSDQIEGGDNTTDTGPNDTVSYADRPGNWLIIAGSGASSPAEVGSDFLGGVENAVGSAGNDDMNGAAGGTANNLQGGPGRDFITGRGGDDVLDGGTNPVGDGDIVSHQSDAVAVDVDLVAGTATGQGSDTISNFEKAFGSSQGDTLAGDGSANILNGLAGNDTLRGRGGPDDLFGGQNTDTITYSDAAGPVTADLSANGTANDGDGSTDAHGGDVENIIGSPGADDLTGNNNTNDISSLGGADIVRVRDAIADTVDCGANADRVVIDPADVAITNCETSDFAGVPAVAITGSNPASGSNDNAPGITGTAPGDATVSLHTASDCSGPELASGSATAFASGLSISVADNSTTTVYAKAANGDVDGVGCSAGFTYIESTPAPAAAAPVNPGGGAVQDLIAPETSITKPLRKTTDTTPTFRFSSSERASTFECKVDKGAYAPCKSPFTLKKLKRGRHTLTIRAKDSAGNADKTPAILKFTVIRKKAKKG